MTVLIFLKINWFFFYSNFFVWLRYDTEEYELESSSDESTKILKKKKNKIVNDLNLELNADSERFSKKMCTTNFFLKASEGKYTILLYLE